MHIDNTDIGDILIKKYIMDTQFTDLSVPDINHKYQDCSWNSCKGFTYLMKLVVCVKKFPDAYGKIVQILANDPEEINKQNEFGYTALMYALLQHNTCS